MKKLLYILRHAKAEAAADTADDHARPLAERGRADAARLGQWLGAQALGPQSILCSTAERTRQTLEALTLDAPAAFSDRLYLASATEMLDLIRNTDATTSRLMLIGHNAGAHELVALLTADGTDEDIDRLRLSYPTCALAILSYEGSWNSLKPATMTLEKLLYPGDLA